jgi:hypothetical protein
MTARNKRSIEGCISGRTAALLIAAILLAAVAGCDGNGGGPAADNAARSEKPSAEEPEDEKSIVPDLPDEVATGTDETGMEVIVKNPEPDREAGRGSYDKNPEVPSGTLVGACRWAAPVTVDRRHRPDKVPVDLDKKYAIKDPKKGEVEYYKNLKLKERQYIGASHRARHSYPAGVVLMMRNVKQGKRAMISRASFMIRHGRFRPHMQFCPVNERVMFGTYDSYGTHVHMKMLGSGEVMLDEFLTAFDRDTIKPLGGGGVHYTVRPKMIQSEVVHQMGGCRITGKRHRWKEAYVFFVDNPYAVVAHGPVFSFGQVPVGEWAIDVWHPEFRPVEETVIVTIRRNETTELKVLVHPPDWIKKKPKQKEQ